MPSSGSLERSAKELLRHSLATCGLNWLQILVRRARGQNLDHLRAGDLAARFQAIYKTRVWDHPESDSLSGIGSSTAATRAVRTQLPDLLRSLGTQKLLDVGCGDFAWMSQIELPCEYVGIDIVPDVIRSNCEWHAVSGRSFLAIDATKSLLPSADTIFCREVLFHLSFDDVWRIIHNIKLGCARYLIVTNDEGLRFNSDILSGDFRLLNLIKPPFCFPPPILSIADNGVMADRVMSLWEVSSLP